MRDYEASIASLKQEVRLRGKMIDERDNKLSELEARIEALNEARQVAQMREQVERLTTQLDEKAAELRRLRGELEDGKASRHDKRTAGTTPAPPAAPP